MRCLVHILLLSVSALRLMAQTPVAPVTEWLATVDPASQQIVLSWQPSTDTHAMGYHICTGSPCLDYDTVFGRMNTSYICADHLATEPHTYRLHVFDSARNVSALTPPFGPILLKASIDPCDPTVEASWTPYEGMPGSVDSYQLMVCTDPLADTFATLYSIGDNPNAFAFTFSIPDSIPQVILQVTASSTMAGHSVTTFSNRVVLNRPAAATAVAATIAQITYDSLLSQAVLHFTPDTVCPICPYTLWHSADRSNWVPVAHLAPLPSSYGDPSINPFDSLHCYRLSCLDSCQYERFSPMQCIALPPPSSPSAFFANTLLADDPLNGTFRPVLKGTIATDYNLYIYNRMGIQVFHTDDPTAGWTPGSDMPQGVYTYLLRCRFIDNYIKTFTGTITLIR